MPPPKKGQRFVPGLHSTDDASQDSKRSLAAETVADKLQRLRIEGLRQQRNLHGRLDVKVSPSSASGPNAIPVDVALRSSWGWPVAAPAGSERGLPPHLVVRRNGTTQRRGTDRWTSGGYVAPPSWRLKSGTTATDLTRPTPAGRHGGPSPELHERRRIISPLTVDEDDPNCPSDDTTSAVPQSQSSLVDACLRYIALDLSTPQPRTVDVVADLLPNLKERLMRLAAEWTPLSEAGVEAVLAAANSAPPLPFPDGKSSPTAHRSVGNSPKEDSSSWDDETPSEELTSITLSFSQASLAQLRRLLFVKPMLNASTTSLVLAHPGLTSLHVAACPNLPVSPSLLSLLVQIPLQHLSLAHATIAPAFLSTPDVVLNKLASVTPALEELDLSENPSWAGAVHLGALDWVSKWTRLRVLGVRGQLAIRHVGDPDEGPTAPAWLARSRSEQSALVMSFLAERRKQHGVWIDVIV